MKKYLLLSFLLLGSGLALSQSDLLTNFNRQRINKQKAAMTVLGSWAIGNIALGAALQGGAEGDTRYFHQMNIGWNAVNLTIAGLSYWSALRADPAAFDLAQSIQQQHGLQKLLLFNAGLDVGYALGGAYLLERGNHAEPGTKQDRLRGFGKSIILQGAFLFAFDLTTYFILAADNSDIPGLLPQIGMSGEGIGMRWVF